MPQVHNSKHITNIEWTGDNLQVGYKNGSAYEFDPPVPEEVYQYLVEANQLGKSVGTLLDKLVHKQGYKGRKVK